jgi:hypothetical protein
MGEINLMITQCYCLRSRRWYEVTVILIKFPDIWGSSGFFPPTFWGWECCTVYISWKLIQTIFTMKLCSGYLGHLCVSGDPLLLVFAHPMPSVNTVHFKILTSWNQLLLFFGVKQLEEILYPTLPCQVCFLKYGHIFKNHSHASGRKCVVHYERGSGLRMRWGNSEKVFNLVKLAL